MNRLRRAELARDMIGKAALVLAGVWLGVFLIRQVDHAADAAPQTPSINGVGRLKGGCTASARPTDEGLEARATDAVEAERETPTCDPDLLMDHVRKLAEQIGPRPAGSDEETQAAHYLTGYLRGLGYRAAETTDIALAEDHEGTTRNVVAWTGSTRLGRSGLLIGAHYDSFAVDERSPGGNDNASGVATMLETARLCAEIAAPCPLYFAAFGAEERVDEDPDHHHYGSRYFHAHQARPLAAMISVDMVGVGERLYLRYMEPAPEPLLELLEDAASQAGIAVRRKPDEGWSDHEPFARGGVPAVWLQRLEDPAQHTEDDTADQVDAVYLQSAVALLTEFISALTPEHLDAMAAWSAGTTPSTSVPR